MYVFYNYIFLELLKQDIVQLLKLQRKNIGLSVHSCLSLNQKTKAFN